MWPLSFLLIALNHFFQLLQVLIFSQFKIMLDVLEDYMR